MIFQVGNSRVTGIEAVMIVEFVEAYLVGALIGVILAVVIFLLLSE